MARRDISEETKLAIVRDYNDNMPVAEIATKYNVSDSSIYRWASLGEYNVTVTRINGNGIEVDGVKVPEPEPEPEPALENPNHDRTFEVTIKVSGDYLERLVTDPHIAIEKIERKTY